MMERSKNILGKLAVIIIFILIITNAILFRLYIDSEREPYIIQGIVNDNYNISNYNVDESYKLNIIKNFIIEDCGGIGVFYRPKSSWTQEMIVCHTTECNSENYCKDIVKEFKFS